MHIVFLFFQMFHTPSFGEEDYDFLQEKPTISLKPSIGHELNFSSSGFSSSFDGGFSPSDHFYQQEQPRYQSTVAGSQSVNSIVTSRPTGCQQQVLQQQLYNLKSSLPSNQRLYIMSAQRDSIFESLENITPKFPPQDVDLPDISSANDLAAVSASSSILSSGFSAGQMYGQSDMNTVTRNPDIGLHAGSPVNSVGQQQSTASPQSSSMSSTSNVSPPTESSEDSDDSVPLAQVRIIST